MAASLRDLLSQEIERQNQKRCRSPRPTPTPPSVNRRSFDLPLRHNVCFSLPSDHDGQTDPAASDAAARTVVSILVGYIDRFLKDSAFRRRLRDKCTASIAAARKKGAAHAALDNLELGIESIERLAAEGPADGAPRDCKIRSLRNSIRLLTVVTSLNSHRSRGGGGGGAHAANAHLSACAQLYLAVACKIEKDGFASAKHLLQVFIDAPYLARKSLLPDLWDHFLLPHLMHLKVWYKKEAELLSSLDAEDREEQKMKGLNRAYNDRMDSGTAQLAVYYRDWIKVGGKAPPIPAVPLPANPSYVEQWGKSSLSLPQSSFSTNLYQAVFGLSLEPKDGGDGLQIDAQSCNHRNLFHSDGGVSQREPNTAQEPQLVTRRSNSFRLLSCRSMPDAAPVNYLQTPKVDFSITDKKPVTRRHPSNLSRAICLVSESDNLKESEIAVRKIAKAWHGADGYSTVVTALSTASFVEGLLEVIFTSKDDEVLELSISILAELVRTNDLNRQMVLNADPQLEIFLRLLRNSTLFLKAAILIYLLKPKAKQMLSLDWIPLVLRVLDCGDQMQAFFAVQCYPRSAALYLLEQLLMGFDVDRNLENSKQLISVGGLDLLIRRFERGNTEESRSCASLLASCIRADGSCREYLATKIKKTAILQLLLGHQKSDEIAILLLSELICLNRRTQMIGVLKELKDDGFLNTMHVLLVYLQQAPLEQRPTAAALLLQLDLLGDPLKCSIYREEAIDALTSALEHSFHSKKIQESCCRALLLLGSRFSCLGEATSEARLLKKAGLYDNLSDSFRSKEIPADEYVRQEEEEKATEEWLRKLAIVLLSSGKGQFLVALSNCIADGMPRLARLCLVTVAWMSISLASWHNANHLLSLVCSALAPRLFESLSYHRPQEERVLASLSLFNFLSYPGKGQNPNQYATCRERERERESSENFRSIFITLRIKEGGYAGQEYLHDLILIHVLCCSFIISKLSGRQVSIRVDAVSIYMLVLSRDSCLTPPPPLIVFSALKRMCQ
ncbi:E3 ubiquitin-protein ligase [Canna indica]|uniref:E3 ubiquitin-protein ligase n=1 Tax=Canna indica TaxID=4628 RepID=A0AAQ3L090_9LILI|nr:E3 ubiquitin-protein ligase [Canna indica]